MYIYIVIPEKIEKQIITILHYFTRNLHFHLFGCITILHVYHFTTFKETSEVFVHCFPILVIARSGPRAQKNDQCASCYGGHYLDGSECKAPMAHGGTQDGQDEQ